MAARPGQLLLDIQFNTDDYIIYSVTSNDPNMKGTEWCAEHTWSYVFTDVSWGGLFNPPGGYWVGGSWNKWARTEGETWFGPSTASYDNRMGGDCYSAPFAWCPDEYLIAGGWQPIANPVGFGACEALLGTNCSDGTWNFSLKIGPDRLETCGF
jgi:hypothetical protein